MNFSQISYYCNIWFKFLYAGRHLVVEVSSVAGPVCLEIAVIFLVPQLGSITRSHAGLFHPVITPAMLCFTFNCSK